MERDILNTKTLQTVEDLNNTDFSKFTDGRFKSWVRYILYPVAQAELDRVVDLSAEEGSEVKLGDSMGDLYYKREVQHRAVRSRKMEPEFILFLALAIFVGGLAIYANWIR
jgi:1,4-dihydroxy-2-naphthoate octaprenyltransferase